MCSVKFKFRSLSLKFSSTKQENCVGQLIIRVYSKSYRYVYACNRDLCGIVRGGMGCAGSRRRKARILRAIKFINKHYDCNAIGPTRNISQLFSKLIFFCLFSFCSTSMRHGPQFKQEQDGSKRLEKCSHVPLQ